MTKDKAEKFRVAFEGRGRKSEVLEIVEGDPEGFAVNVHAYLGNIVEVVAGNELLEKLGGDPVL